MKTYGVIKHLRYGKKETAKSADLSNRGSAFLLPQGTQIIKEGEKMGRLSKRGQSTLEYVIILTAIVAAVIAGATLIKTKVQAGFDDVQTSIETSTDKIGTVTP